MKLRLGKIAVAEVDAFKSIELTEDGKIIAVFNSSAAEGGTARFVIHDGTKPVGSGPLLIDRYTSVTEE